MLPVREALSGIAGSISLTSWIILLVPQLVENVKNRNAEGVSVAFLLIWLLGDITNLAGAIWGGLLPTVIALAVYFCLADIVLLTQVLYYNYINRLLNRKFPCIEADHGHDHHHHDSVNPDDPHQPLIARRESVSSRRSRRKSSVSRRRLSVQRRRDSLSALIEKHPSTSAQIARNILAIGGTCFAGALGWFIAWKTGAWSGRGGNGDGKEQALGAAILGYTSAVLYLGARIPQIYQNYRKQSCEGLSMLFFMLSLLGNLSYGSGILFHSTDEKYVYDNLPWLLGSLGTMFEDGIIFYQFHKYKKPDGEENASVVI